MDVAVVEGSTTTQTTLFQAAVAQVVARQLVMEVTSQPS